MLRVLNCSVVLRKFLLTTTLSIISVAILWFAPLSKAEREFAELRRKNKWQTCDYKYGGERLFVLRLYRNLSPLIKIFRDLEDKKIRREFHFKLKTAEWANGESSFYWGELKERALRPSKIFNLRRWIYWENDIEKLLNWDSERIANHLIPKSRVMSLLPQDAVQRTGKYELTLFLNSGDFEKTQAIFRRIIENAWSNPPYKLRVLWTNSNPKAFKFIFDPFGKSNHVSYEEKRIFLTESITDATLIHEIGHVLGFGDHYEIYWDDKNCQVAERAYLWDVMANSTYKHSNPGHWNLLMKAYPLAPTNGLKIPLTYSQQETF